MSSKKVAWSMSCLVNEKNFEFNGIGVGNSTTGVVEMQFEASAFPEGFEPASCPCICNAPATIAFARNDQGLEDLLEVSGGQLSVEPARVGAVFDAKGVELLRLSVSSTVLRKGSSIVIGNEMKGFSHLPPIERTLTPVHEFVLPNGPGSAIATIRFHMLTKAGEILTGLTTVPYRWTNGATLSKPMTRRYENIDVQWDGGRSVKSVIQSHLLSHSVDVPELAFKTQQPHRTDGLKDIQTLCD